MQVMPETASRYGINNPVRSIDTNLRAGTSYLRDLMNMFDGRIELVLAAYVTPARTRYYAMGNAFLHIVRRNNTFRPYCRSTEFQNRRPRRPRHRDTRCTCSAHASSRSPAR